MNSKYRALLLCIIVFHDLIFEGLCDGDRDAENEHRDHEMEFQHKADDEGKKNGQVDNYSGVDNSGGEQAGTNGNGTGAGDLQDVLANKGRYDEADTAFGSIVGSNSQRIKKNSMSGMARAIDDRMAQIDAIGGDFGLPEDLVGHVRWCAQVIYSGLYGVVYFMIRYPLKLLSKAILLTGTINHIAGYLVWFCISPISWMDFASENKKINAHNEALKGIKLEFKKRVIWVTDKCEHRERQKYMCCSYSDYRRKIEEEVPEATNHIRWYFRNLYGAPYLIYCMNYLDFQGKCTDVDLSVATVEPERIVPQSFITVGFELFDKYW